jgi:predicted RNA-binding Zn ribbon-like protein
MINTIREESLNLNDDWLCLDFANTVDWHASDKPTENLNTYLDLLNWSLEKGLISDLEAKSLHKQAALHSDQAQAKHEQAIELREAIYNIFSDGINGNVARPADLDILNGWLTAGASHLKLNSVEKGFTWSWSDDETSLEQMLWWVALSAARLLASENLALVGKCADDRGCGWLFFDTSRNHSRRWCAMKDCGNRAKSRRHYGKIQDLKAEKAV